MTQHATVVYYAGFDNNSDAFHVMNINHKNLQSEFHDHDILSIKCITLETESLATREFKTLFMESDIQNFLKGWKIDF
jgi:hypothetical protein